MLLGGLPNSVLSQTRDTNISDLCTEFSQAEMRTCLQEEVRKSTAALGRGNLQMTQALNAWDETPRYRTAALTALRRSESAFVAYRKSHCAFDASLGGGAIGTALDSRSMRCIIQFNLERVGWLDAKAKAIPKR
jgi:uncharacterized protein YecT (DUF1311 family)